MNIEDVIVNLKVISKLTKNQKINTYQTHLNIEQKALIPEWARRWARQDNRDTALIKINNNIDMAIEYDKANSSKQYAIKSYLRDCKPGLEHLKETYILCTQTGSRIDLLIDKIDNFLMESNDGTFVNNIYEQNSEDS